MTFLTRINIHTNDKTLIENDVVFIYHCTDGFNRRGLRVTLVVRSDFKFQMCMKSFENQSSTGKPFEFILNGNLPIEIWNSINFLCNQKGIEKYIKHGYGRYFQNAGDSTFKLRSSNKFIETRIHLIDIEVFEKVANPAEKELIKLYDLLNDWIKSLYTTLMAK
ncbi:MAG: hypothetical protein K1X55_08975 [Chitinophagales bacterium]|nr:hypothetical protein [Chitinophagales bacterium]